MKRHTNIIAVFLIVEKNNKVLLLRRFNTGYRDGDLGMISGHVEAGESAIQAIIREAKEEAAITITEQDIEMLHVMHRKSLEDQSERIDFYFKTNTWQGQPKVNDPEKCNELVWADKNNLPNDMIEYLKIALDAVDQQQSYSEFGW
jgi:8-oxo-dGTP pyrophosphatase MutT (NUDIX family)